MKTCVITGAASGIGAALAHRYAAAGYHIIGIDRDASGAERVRTQLGSDFILAELSAHKGLERVALELAGTRIDVLIHSAGLNDVIPFSQADIKTQSALFQVNLIAPIILTRRLLLNGNMASNSSIIFITSLSHQVSYPGAAVYAASKDGLVSFARSLSVALHPDLHVLTVFPGPTRTPHAQQHSPDNRNASKRMAPEHLANLIYTAQQKRRYRLVPGFRNKVFAFFGTVLPAMAERIMRKSIFEKLQG
jgi:short-subunit dehydrogenase